MMLAIFEIQICERKGRKTQMAKTQMTKTKECKAPWTTELENPKQLKLEGTISKI
jgi:hypothetical protein